VALWHAVGQLRPRFREIVVLRDYQGLSYGEISVALNIPTGTVMSRLHRARAKLREMVKANVRGEAHDA
jgi:RNA polymerase sigma-70 factor (ECF subfamily)